MPLKLKAAFTAAFFGFMNFVKSGKTHTIVLLM